MNSSRVFAAVTSAGLILVAIVLVADLTSDSRLKASARRSGHATVEVTFKEIR